MHRCLFMQKKKEKKKEKEEEAQGPWLSDYIAGSTWRMNNSDTRHNETLDELVLCSKCSHLGIELLRVFQEIKMDFF